MSTREASPQGSSMGERIRTHRWERTPLGDLAHWPAQLKTLMALMVGSNQPMFVAWGPARTLLYNDMYAEVLGTKHPAALGNDFLEVWHEIRDDLTPIVAAAYRGEPVQMDRIHLRMLRHGYLEDALFSFFYSPIRDDGGEVAGFFCACSDITEAALASERVQLALDAGAILGTWVWTIPDNRFIADERFAASFDLDPDLCRRGLPLERVMESIHLADHDHVNAAVSEAISRGGPYRCEYRVRSGAGGYRWVEANGRVELDEQGRAIRFPGVLLDIELRRRTESERDRATALLTTFTEAVPGVVYAKDRQGRYLIANRGTADVFGLPFGGFIGRTDAEILPDPTEAQRIAAVDRRVMESGQTEQTEESLPRADGRPAIWWSTKSPLRDATGAVVGLVGASVDITDRKRMEDALRQADKRKDEFLAMLAHELRNPLAPISSAAELLDLAATDPVRVQQVASIITRQVRHMSELVDDLLDVSRVTRGLVELDRVPVDLRAVLTAAIEQVEPMLQARRHVLSTEQQPGPVTVLGDRHRLVQVVSNLLNNAAKYTPPGGCIRLRLATGEATVEVHVSDDGIGIEPELLPHVFELFTQAERTPDRAQGGLGIGLALVHSIVQLHGGQVTAHSAGPGHGSTFTLTLPLMAAQDLSVGHPAPESGSGEPRDILLVDDNADAAATLSELLRALGHRVEVAHDGAEALASVRRSAHWDAFVLDIGLPDMTGYELAAQLRAQSRGCQPLFVALTGYGGSEDRLQSRAAGFRHHLVKPVDFERLREILQER